MIGTFEVIDYVRSDYAASATQGAKTVHHLFVRDIGECPLRQIPKYQLLDGECEKFANSGSTGKQLKIEIREMGGRVTPVIKGRIVGQLGVK